MKLLIKFPTRNRRDKFLPVLKKYSNFLSKKNDVHFLITMDEDDLQMNNDSVKDVLKTYNNLSFFYGDSKTKIEAVNKDLDKIQDWDIVLLASDDMIPVVRDYDDIIIENMKKYYSDTDGVLWFNDGYQGDKLNTLSILGKKYYDRFEYIYNPEYKSVWCDNEFMSVANILNKQTYIKDIIIKHEHPDYGFGKRDDIHINNLKNESTDRNLFNKRKLNNFGL
jgi:hypothetical protein